MTLKLTLTLYYYLENINPTLFSVQLPIGNGTSSSVKTKYNFMKVTVAACSRLITSCVLGKSQAKEMLINCNWMLKRGTRKYNVLTSLNSITEYFATSPLQLSKRRRRSFLLHHPATKLEAHYYYCDYYYSTDPHVIKFCFPTLSTPLLPFFFLLRRSVAAAYLKVANQHLHSGWCPDGDFQSETLRRIHSLIHEPHKVTTTFHSTPSCYALLGWE